MFIQLSRRWWWLALHGITVILFGIIALTWRGDTLRSFMLLFGAFALVESFLCIFAALINRAGGQHWWFLLQALISLALAVYTFIWTEFATTILLYMVAAWSLITGILEVTGARRLGRHVSNERLLHQSGMASMIFAVLVTLLTTTGMLGIAEGIGVSAILFGLLTMVLSLNLRSMGKFAHSVSHV